MKDEIEIFLDEMYADEEEPKPMSRMECAAFIQFWREAGVKVPEKLTAGALFTYNQARIEAAKKAKKPIKLYEFRVCERLSATFLIEAHDQDEAETIFDEWSATPDGCKEIQSRLVDSAEGWVIDDMPCEYEWDDTPDVTWEEGSKLL